MYYFKTWMSEVHDTLAGLRAAYLWLAGWASLPSYLLPRLWTNAALFKPADRPPRHFQHELSPSQYCYFFPYFGLFIRKKTADEPVNLTAIHVRLLVSTTLSALRVEISQHSSCSFSPVNFDLLHKSLGIDNSRQTSLQALHARA